MLQKTPLLKKEEVKRAWYLIDATEVILGRLATQIARLLRGKNKRDYTPHVDSGNFVVVTNASRVRLTGKKLIQKFHFRHSGYPGGAKHIPYSRFLKENPNKVVFEAVKGMLPRNRTRKKILTRLKVFKDAEHKHHAQLNQGQNAKVVKGQEFGVQGQESNIAPEQKNVEKIEVTERIT